MDEVKRTFTVAQLEEVGELIRRALADEQIATVNWPHRDMSARGVFADPLNPRTFLAERLRGHIGDWFGHSIFPNPEPEAIDPRGKFSGTITPAQIVRVLTSVIRSLAAAGVVHTYKEDVNGLRAIIERFLEEQGYVIESPFPQSLNEAGAFYWQALCDACVLAPLPYRK